MNKIIILLFMVILIGCKGGDGGPTDTNHSPEPIAPISPFDPNKDYIEVMTSWVFILNPYIEVRYEPNIDRLYLCDEDYCRLPTKSDYKSNHLNPGECITSASYLYGAYRICFTEIIDDLGFMNSIWVSVESIL